MGKRYGDINFDNIYAIDHQTGDIVLIKGEGSRIFPNDFRKEMHLWPTIAQRASFVALLLEKELGYPVDMEWAQALKGPFSWLQLRLLQKKPPISLPTIPAEAQLLRSEHVKGRGIADFRSVIFIGDFHYDEETLNQYCQKHPDSLILYMTAASRVVNDRVEDKLLPLTKCVIIADTWMDHQASKKLGINHFALNLEEEDKLFIYTPDHKIAKIIKQGKVVENNNDVNFPIKVLSFEQPVRVIVDSENDIGIVFLTGQ
jgi:hypothetical protein